MKSTPLNSVNVKSSVNIASLLHDHRQVIRKLEGMTPQIELVAKMLTQRLQKGGKILWMGNGGSAADAQHLAAELVVRFTRERKGLAAIALTTDSSILTAAGNDYDFEMIFARQIEALCSPKDAVVGISTSGTSPNIVAGILAAQKIGAYTVALTGASGGKLKSLVDVCLDIPSSTTARIQEVHILIGHIICDWIEAAIVEGQ